MKLYINGQDIKRLILKDLDSTEDALVFDCSPEKFLTVLVKFLEDRNTALNEVKEIYVVVGSGSATSLRTVVSIVNILGWTQKISLHGFTKNTDEQDIDSIRRILGNTMKYVSECEMVEPEYSESPHITLTTRDSLKRKL